MTSESIERDPSHDWSEDENADSVYWFCADCFICSCHVPDKSALPCPGEPQFGDE